AQAFSSPVRGSERGRGPRSGAGGFLKRRALAASGSPPCISKRQRRIRIGAAVAEGSPITPTALKAVTELGTLSALSVNNPDSRSGRRVSPHSQGREMMEAPRFVGIDVS